MLRTTYSQLKYKLSLQVIILKIIDHLLHVHLYLFVNLIF